MPDNTKIPWADASWNPLAGCSDEPISPGCQNCYARMLAHRMGNKGQHFESLATAEKWTGEVRFYRHLLAKPLNWKKPRNIFVGSMGDLFYEGIPWSVIDEVFGVIAACAIEREHRFLILTKRPDRLNAYFTQRGVLDRWMRYARTLIDAPLYSALSQLSMPLKNVWIGTSAEDQIRFDKRVGWILIAPAVGRFVSIEPMLGHISMQHESDGRGCVLCSGEHSLLDCAYVDGAALNWVICGGESGPRARPTHPDWVRDIKNQCIRSTRRIPFMFKQWGTWKPVDWYSQATHAVRISDGYTIQLDHEPYSAARCQSAPAGWCGVARLGKAESGRILEGQEYMEFPW